MEKNIDEMLHLTADIAEELLALKDNGNGVDADLCARIHRLADLADESLAQNSREEVEAPGEEYHSHVPEVTGSEVDYDERIEELTDGIIHDEADEMMAENPDGEAGEEVELTESEALIEQARREAMESEEETEPEPEEMPEETPEATTEAMPETNEDEEIADAAEFEEVNDSEPEAGFANAVTAEELRNAFTINDVFLYQRVLFKGSGRRFSEALEYAATCGDIDRFRSYLADTLHINLKTEEARDFIAIIHQYV